MATRSQAKKTVNSVPKLPLPKKPPTPRGEKKTHKLGPEHIQLILDMTISGYTLEEIKKELKESHKITITDAVICYHRRQNADKLSLTEEEQIKAARARSGYMQLATRIATLEKAITRELKKKNPSGYSISMLMSAIDQAIHKVEALRLKREELARRAGANNGATSFEEYIADMTKRSKIIQAAELVEAEIIESGAGGELIVKPPSRLESLENVPAPVNPVLEGSEDERDDEDDGIDESDLLA